ncbi:MAG: hypothetical protein H0W77_15070 [Acidobacteria bacterium]|nr:hypothetical protein [Acidobacteriota bacterium]
MNKTKARVILTLVLFSRNDERKRPKRYFTFMEKEKEFIVLISFSVLSFLICVVCGNLMLPKYCSLFLNNELNRLACDGMRDWKVDPCPIYEDKSAATAATIIFELGI